MRITAACLGALLVAGAVRAESEVGKRLTATATQLLEALPEGLRADALFPFEDEERGDIRFAPLFLDGARYGHMPEHAASLAETLLAISLSPRGFERVALIRRNELEIAKQEAASWV